MKKILLLGKSGQVGWELQRSLAPLGQVIALDRESLTSQQALSWEMTCADTPLCGNLSDLLGLEKTIHTLQPDIIVNAAAYTAVDKAEAESDLARRINAEAPCVLAQAARKAGALLVHYSTDYVFNGSGNNHWEETDSTDALNVYGQTKLEGEEAIAASGCQHLIFRTSWVYGVRGGNFAKTMIRLAQERDQLQIITDQFGAPTGAELIADITAHAIRATLIQPNLSGLYHLAAGGTTNWHGYASYVIEQARDAGFPITVASKDIHAVSTSAFPTAARRPHNSRLNTAKLQEHFCLSLPDWQQGVNRMLAEIFRN